MGGEDQRIADAKSVLFEGAFSGWERAHRRRISAEERRVESGGKIPEVWNSPPSSASCLSGS